MSAGARRQHRRQARLVLRPDAHEPRRSQSRLPALLRPGRQTLWTVRRACGPYAGAGASVSRPCRSLSSSTRASVFASARTVKISSTALRRSLNKIRLPRSNAPTLQRFNASTLQRFNASTLQHFNASTLQRFNAPTLQRSNASTLQRFNAPTLQRSNAPTLQRSNAPTLQRSNAPTLQRSNAPTLQRSNASTLQRFNPSTLQPFNAYPGLAAPNTLSRMTSFVFQSSAMVMARGSNTRRIRNQKLPRSSTPTIRPSQRGKACTWPSTR